MVYFPYRLHDNHGADEWGITWEKADISGRLYDTSS